MNRKGFVGDTFAIIYLLFFFIFVVMLFSIVLTTFKDGIVGMTDIDERAKTIIQTGEDGYPRVMDFWFVLFLVGLPLGSAILAYFNDIHPLFFWMSLLFVVMVVILGAGLSELWKALETDADLALAMSRFPMANYVMHNFGMYSVFIFVVIAFGTFVKLRNGGSGGYYT